MLKRNQRLSVMAIAGAAILAIGAGCGGGDSTTETSTVETVRSLDVKFKGPESGLPTEYPQPQPAALSIGLLNPRGATEVLRDIFDSAKDEIEQLGGESIELDAEQDPDKQVNQFEQLLNEKVDAIGILPIAGPELIGPLLARAGKAGIPVVGIDVTPGEPKPLPGIVSQVWQRRDRMIYLQVKTAAEDLGQGARIGRIGFAVPVPVLEFAEVRTRYWVERFGLELVDEVESTADTVDAAQEAAAGLLADNPDIVGVLGYNDEAAIGAALAARAASRDVRTYGIVGGSLAASSLTSDRLTATVRFDGADMGRKLAAGLYDAAQGTKIPPVVLAGEPFVVTEENVEEIPAG